MTKEEADAAVAAAIKNVVDAARAHCGYPRSSHQLANSLPVLVKCLDDLNSAESARKALDRPRLTPLDEFLQKWSTSSYRDALVRARELEILAEAALLPSCTPSDLYPDWWNAQRPSHWDAGTRLISLADLGRLVLGDDRKEGS